MERGRAPHRRFTPEELSKDLSSAFPLKKFEYIPAPSEEVIEYDDTDILPESQAKHLKRIFEEGPDFYALNQSPTED